jgi:hypothetical protein
MEGESWTRLGVLHSHLTRPEECMALMNYDFDKTGWQTCDLGGIFREDA